MPKLQEQKSGSYYVSIPKDFIKKLQWKAGDAILITFFDEEKLKLEKM